MSSESSEKLRQNVVDGGGGEFFMDEDQRLAFELIAFHVNAGPIRLDPPVESVPCLQQALQLPADLCIERIPRPSLTFVEFEQQAALELEALQDVRPQVVSQVKNIWDDIAMTHQSAGFWANEFVAGSYGPVELTAVQYLEEQVYRFDQAATWVDVGLTRSAPSVPLDELWVGYDDWPGLVTSLDVAAVRLGAQLFELINPLEDEIIENGIGGIFGDTNGISEADIKRFLPLLPVALRDVVEEAIDSGLFVGERFGWEDLRELAEIIAGVAGVAAIFASGPAAAFLLAIAGAAGLGVVAIRIDAGEWGWALAEGAFLILDLFELRAAVNAVRLIRSTNDVLSGVSTLTNAGQISGNRLADEFDAITRSLDNGAQALDDAFEGVEGAAMVLADTRATFAEIGQRLRNQSPTVTASPSVRRAYYEAATRDVLVERAKLGIQPEPGLSGEAADEAVTAAANQIVDAMFLSGRVDLDEVEFLAAQRFFDDVDSAGVRAWEIGGDDAVRLGDDAKVAVRENCFASFSPASQIVMASGDTMPIGDVRVGDQVLSWGPDNTVTTGVVTATIPHTDVLLDAVLSDGSVLRVTEDHRFLSATTGEWVEIQDLTRRELIVTVSGDHVTVDELDWASAAEEQAFDLTVAESHNYVVVADGSSHQLVAHNETKLCELPLGTSYFDLIKLDKEVQEQLAEALAELRTGFVDPVDGTRAVRAAGSWAADNPATAPSFFARIQRENPGWLEAAATASEADLRFLLDAAQINDDLLKLSDDTVRLLAERATALRSSYSSDELTRVVRHVTNKALDPFASVDQLQRMIRNAGDEPATIRRALAADDHVSGAGVLTTDSIAFEVLLHKRLTTVVGPNHDFVIDEIAESIIDRTRSGDFTTPAEHAAADDLKSLQAAAGAGAHGFNRHSADTTLMQHYRRVAGGRAPDGGPSQRTSTRSVSHQTHLLAVETAIEQRRLTGSLDDVVVEVLDGDGLRRLVGEGFAERGIRYFDADLIQVSFDQSNGQWVTNTFLEVGSGINPTASITLQ